MAAFVSQYKNRVLAALPKTEISRLAPHLSPVTLKVRDQLLDGHNRYAYFPEEGLASVVVSMENGATVEVGVVGRDGVVGLSSWERRQMPGQTYIQIPGNGFRIKADRQKDEFERPGELRRHRGHITLDEV